MRRAAKPEKRKPKAEARRAKFATPSAKRQAGNRKPTARNGKAETTNRKREAAGAKRQNQIAKRQARKCKTATGPQKATGQGPEAGAFSKAETLGAQGGFEKPNATKNATRRATQKTRCRNRLWATKHRPITPAHRAGTLPKQGRNTPGHADHAPVKY